MNTELKNEFTGLSLRHNAQSQVRMEYTTEQLALAAIAAMKEQALEDYNAPLRDFDFQDSFHPENPIHLIMNGAYGADPTMLVRSTVMWTLVTLSLDLMRTDDLAYVAFDVKYRYRALYQGSLVSRVDPTASKEKQNDPAVARPPPKSPVSLDVIATTEPTNVILQTSPSLKDHPLYELEFSHHPGHVIPRFRVFQSILILQLQLGKRDAASLIGRVSLHSIPYEVWIYMKEVLPGARVHAFQQYHAVAILEAIARHQAARWHRYKELTFKFKADGILIGEGCLTRPVNDRAWCAGLDGRGVVESLSIGNVSDATDWDHRNGGSPSSRQVVELV